MELFEAADLFGLERLKKMCEQSIMLNINTNNAATIFQVFFILCVIWNQAADMHHAQILRDHAMNFVLQNFDEVSKVMN